MTPFSPLFLGAASLSMPSSLPIGPIQGKMDTLLRSAAVAVAAAGRLDRNLGVHDSACPGRRSAGAAVKRFRRAVFS